MALDFIESCSAQAEAKSKESGRAEGEKHRLRGEGGSCNEEKEVDGEEKAEEARGRKSGEEKAGLAGGRILALEGMTRATRTLGITGNSSGLGMWTWKDIRGLSSE